MHQSDNTLIKGSPSKATLFFGASFIAGVGPLRDPYKCPIAIGEVAGTAIQIIKKGSRVASTHPSMQGVGIFDLSSI
jgi:hypothetical protein